MRSSQRRMFHSLPSPIIWLFCARPGLVNVREEGKQTFYSLNQDRMVACCGQLMIKFAPEMETTEALKLTVHN